MLVIGATGALAWLITVEQVAVQMATWIKFVASEPWMFLLLVNVAARPRHLHRAAAALLLPHRCCCRSPRPSGSISSTWA
jgi:hypothetical protein